MYFLAQKKNIDVNNIDLKKKDVPCPNLEKHILKNVLHETRNFTEKHPLIILKNVDRTFEIIGNKCENN